MNSTATRLVTSPNPEKIGEFLTNNVTFVMNIKRLNDISTEFEGVDKSVSKDATIKKGVERLANSGYARALEGHKFLVHRNGEEFPRCFKLSESFEKLADGVMPIDPFIPDSEFVGDVFKASQYKQIFKGILHYAHLLYTNEEDHNILYFEIRTEPGNEEFINQLFQMGMEEKNLNLSLTETTDFTITEE